MLRGLSAVVVMLASSVAVARPAVTKLVAKPPQKNVSLATFPGSTIYINRCTGGCVANSGPPDATTDTSDLIGAPVTIPDPMIDDTQWAMIMDCVRQVYSPFNINIT